MPTIHVILDEIEELGAEDQEYVITIVQNRLRDRKRAELASRAQKAMENVDAGNVKTGGFQELWADLND